jgi:hypothetical protein
MSTLIGVVPEVKATGFPPASVPDTLFKERVKSTTPGKPSNPEATKSIVTNSPENLSISIPPNSSVPDAERSSLVYKLKALEAMYPCLTRRTGKLSY